MDVQETISQKLNQAFSPEHIDILNESHMHAGPATDSHFKLTLVSDDFSGKRPVARHQSVYAVLAKEMEGPVHALALHLYTPDEWQQRLQQVPASPNCAGANK